MKPNRPSTHANRHRAITLRENCAIDYRDQAHKPSEGIVATTVGIVFLLLGATTVFGELQDALDRIWRAPAKEAGGAACGACCERGFCLSG